MFLQSAGLWRAGMKRATIVPEPSASLIWTLTLAATALVGYRRRPASASSN